MSYVIPGKKVSLGLEGVIAMESRISTVDGTNGVLIYSGYDIHELAKNASFEEVIYLLLHDKLPNISQLAELKKQLADERKISAGVKGILKKYNRKISPMHALRSAVSFLATEDATADDLHPDLLYKKTVSLISKISMMTAALARIRGKKNPVQPKKNLSESANFLYMLKGKMPQPVEEKAFDLCMILHAEHGLNASTFTGRCTASTLSDIYSAVTSAIGSLKGPLHGGANTDVMNMLLDIGEPNKAKNYILNRIANKQKIPGFGHRVYKTVDPRSVYLEELSHELAEKTKSMKWYEISENIKQTMREEMDAKGKPVYPNVDFFSASVYYMMGISPDMYTPIFAMSRMAGWCANVMEQYRNNRLIRPDGLYTGNMGLKYVPIEQRG